MTEALETTYHPMLEPGRPAGYPVSLRRQDCAWVPINARATQATRKRLDTLARRWRLWASFVRPDRTLLEFQRRDPLGLAALDAAPFAGATTMDVPYYGFFTPAMRDRVLARTLWIQAASMDAFQDRGLACIPLVKGLDAATIQVQLEFLAQQGIRQAAFYAREHLLEHDPTPVRRFVTACRTWRIRGVLIGATRPWQPRTPTVGSTHAVAARRSERISRNGARIAARTGFQSLALDRWVDAGDVRGLTQHNLWMIRHRHVGPRPLTAAA